MKKVKVLVANQHLKIYIAGILHLSVSAQNLAAFHSYKLSDDRYNVDIHLKEGESIELSYTTHKMWVAVLKGLDKIRLF